MIGLIRKEMYALWALYRKNLILVLVMYTFLGVALNNMVFPYMTIWMAGIYSFGWFSADQMSGWARYARTLPVSDKQVVASRFLSTLILQLAAGIYAVVIALINSIWGNGGFIEELGTIIVFFSMSVMGMGIMIPAAFKWGVEKARTGFSLGFGAIAGVIWYASSNVEEVSGVIIWLQKLNGPLVMIVVAGVVYLLGYLLGCRVYRRKDF